MGSPLKIKLSTKKQAALQQLKRKRNSNIGERAQYVLLAAEGHRVSSIAKQLGRNKHTIRTWIKRYETEGTAGLNSIQPPGRPNQKAELVGKQLKELLNKSPRDYGYIQSGWQVNLLVDYFKQQGHVISPNTLRRALKKANWVYKRFAKEVPCSISREEKRLVVKELVTCLEKEIANDDVEILFEDESHFTNEPYVERGWFVRGEKKR